MSRSSTSFNSPQLQQLTTVGYLLALQLRRVTELTIKLTNNLVFVACNPSKHQLTEIEVITGFATLQAALDHLSRAYVTHTDTVLGRAPGSALELKTLGDSILDNGLPLQRGATPGALTDAGDGKKKRKRAPHDKNAPKRPLTPYFLYMQDARPTIAKDMPSTAAPKDIAEEGTKRWANMDKFNRTVRNIQHAVPRLTKLTDLVRSGMSSISETSPNITNRWRSTRLAGRFRISITSVEPKLMRSWRNSFPSQGSIQISHRMRSRDIVTRKPRRRNREMKKRKAENLHHRRKLHHQKLPSVARLPRMLRKPKRLPKLRKLRPCCPLLLAKRLLRLATRTRPAETKSK
jgi:hypothetical protein